MTTLDSKSKKNKAKWKNKNKKPTFLDIFRGIQVEAGFEEDT